MKENMQNANPILKTNPALKKFRIIFLLFSLICLTCLGSSDAFCQEATQTQATQDTQVTPTTAAAIKNDNKKASPVKNKKTEMKINSDKLDYNPEKNEIIATGNAEVIIDEQNSRLLADKITYNPDTQIVVAEKNVRLIRNGQVLKGDFTRINLQEESAIVDKPNTKINIIKINAETANVYTDKLDALKGKAEITEKLNVFLQSDCFGDYQRKDNLRDEYFNRNVQTTIAKKLGSTYRIQTNEIIIDSQESKNIITMKKSNIFIGKHKVAYVPNLVIKTDKAYSQYETQLPEIGTVRQMGMYLGPSKLFNLPGDATIKVSPILSYYNKLGVGGLARYKTDTNKTEIGYATSISKFVINGEQNLPKSFKLNYGLNSYVDDGFMGDRLPQYYAEIAHDKIFDLKDFNATYRNRFAAGYVSDFDSGWGTTRFTWMGDLAKPIWGTPKDKFSLYINPQFAVRAYGNGATTGVVRIGPVLETRFGDWFNRFGYYIAGVEGESPMMFDKYYYGKNSINWMTEKRINKYLNLGFSTTLTLNKDNYDSKLLSEDQIFMRIGPDDMKFRIGYDIVRQRSMFGMDMLVGSDKTAVDFNKLKVINPSDLKKKQTKKQNDENNNSGQNNI